jgi:dTMP kinase
VLVVLEGIDGSGKTTLGRGIAASLSARGFEVVETKEPTDGPIGQQIRALAERGRSAVSPEEEFRLFHEDRRAHVASLVKPALDAGKVVVQDRSYFSTIVYQGDRGLDRARLLSMSEAIAPKPDVLFVVDVPAEVAVARIRRARPTVKDDFETLETLTRIRQVFLDLPGATVIDGTLSEGDALKVAMEIIAARQSSTRPGSIHTGYSGGPDGTPDR